MIDLHSHVLPAIDDGPASLDESLRILAAAEADGVRKIAATPHVSDRYPTTVSEMRDGFRRVSEAAVAAGLSIEILPGGELDTGRAATMAGDELAAFGLGGSRRYVLLEFPDYGWGVSLLPAVAHLQACGLQPVLAHPERNAEVQAQPARLAPLVAEGVLVQLTAASVDGRLGRRSQKAADELLRLGCAHMIASDSHGFEVRATGVATARKRVGDDALGRWLTEEVPAAVVSGDEAPPRPTARASRSWHRGV